MFNVFRSQLERSFVINLLLTTTRPEEALKWAEQAVILAPDNSGVWSALAGAYLANGSRLEATGDPASADLAYAEAVRAARASIDINPSNAVAFATVAGALAQLGPEQYANAQEAAEIGLSLEPVPNLAGGQVELFGNSPSG